MTALHWKLWGKWFGILNALRRPCCLKPITPAHRPSPATRRCSPLLRLLRAATRSDCQVGWATAEETEAMPTAGAGAAASKRKRPESCLRFQRSKTSSFFYSALPAHVVNMANRVWTRSKPEERVALPCSAPCFSTRSLVTLLRHLLRP